MRRDFDADWNDLQAEWQAFVVTLDHGFDFERMAIDFQKGEPLAGSSRPIDISAQRGWQSSGVWLEAGQSYNVTATGRYQIATEEVDGKKQAWPCEPGGVSIVYNDGHPLGMLLGAIHTGVESPSNDPMSFADPIPIGLRAIIKPTKSGTLYLRVNDSAAKLDDNRGSLAVTVERTTDADRK